MKVSDLKQVPIGLRLRSMADPTRWGTVIAIEVIDIDEKEVSWAWVKWDGDGPCYSGFYGVDCECEIEDAPVM